MTRCSLCNSLKKNDEDAPRLAFDFTPDELSRSASESSCDCCQVLLEGLMQSQNYNSQSFLQSIRRIYARCYERQKASVGTLCLDVYFKDDRPKLELELYSLQRNGTFDCLESKEFHLLTWQ